MQLARRRQRGQALVLGLFLTFLGAILLFYLFNAGQVSADKQRVTNTADAAAYSGALWRARVLNYDAYSNRAMIANEVAIAQTLTLTSEIQYQKNLAACLAGQAGDGGETCVAALSVILRFFPYIQAAFAYAQYALDYYDQALQYGGDHSIISAEVYARSSAINRVLSASQTAMHASTNFAALDLIVRQVVNANDAKFSTVVLPDLFEGGNSAFTKQYSGNDRIRLANVVRAGLDPYSKGRSFTLPLGIPCVVGFDYKKRGSTALNGTLDRWEAADTLSEWHYGFDPLKGCTDSESPMGWGDRQASDGPNDNPPGNTGDNPNALQYARDAAYQPAGYAGIQNFRDLNYQSLSGVGGDTAVRNPTYAVGVVVRHAQANLRTSNNLNLGIGRLRMPEKIEQGRMASLASAEVYFKRPAARPDGRTELPSLFNPYWQARLAEPTVAQKAAALVALAAP